MAKKKKNDEDTIEMNESELNDVVVTEKKEVISSENKIRVNDFLESNDITKGKYNLSSSGFKTWWTLDQKRSIGEMLTVSEWEKEFKTFLNRKIKA